MRIVQTVILKVLGLAMLVAGGALVLMWWNDGTYQEVVRLFKEVFRTSGGIGLGVGCVVLGILGIWPWTPRKAAKNTISFPGMHGDVTIELDAVEATISRMVGKMPEVKRIKVKVTPSEDNRRAVVHGDVVMNKGVLTASAHQIADRIADYLTDTAVNILGVEEVVRVNLNVRNILVDAKHLPVPHAPEPVPTVVEEPPAPAPEPEPPTPAPAPEPPEPAPVSYLPASSVELEDTALDETPEPAPRAPDESLPGEMLLRPPLELEDATPHEAPPESGKAEDTPKTQDEKEFGAPKDLEL